MLKNTELVRRVCDNNTFVCPSVVKASEVGARSAVIAWRTSTVVYYSYRLTYQVAGEETKVIHLPSPQSLTEHSPDLYVIHLCAFCCVP